MRPTLWAIRWLARGAVAAVLITAALNLLFGVSLGALLDPLVPRVTP